MVLWTGVCNVSLSRAPSTTITSLQNSLNCGSKAHSPIKVRQQTVRDVYAGCLLCSETLYGMRSSVLGRVHGKFYPTPDAHCTNSSSSRAQFSKSITNTITISPI